MLPASPASTMAIYEETGEAHFRSIDAESHSLDLQPGRQVAKEPDRLAEDANWLSAGEVSLGWPDFLSYDLVLKATRGVTIAVVSSRERQRR